MMLPIQRLRLDCDLIHMAELTEALVCEALSVLEGAPPSAGGGSRERLSRLQEGVSRRALRALTQQGPKAGRRTGAVFEAGVLLLALADCASELTRLRVCPSAVAAVHDLTGAGRLALRSVLGLDSRGAAGTALDALDRAVARARACQTAEPSLALAAMAVRLESMGDLLRALHRLERARRLPLRREELPLRGAA